MGSRDDIYVIEKVTAGDTEAFAMLVNRHKDLVFTIAMNISRNREDAEEIAQDTFVKAFQKLGSFRKESRFSTWLYRIAYNEAISMVRKNRLTTVALGEEITEAMPEEEIETEIAGMDESEQKTVVREILARLPETDQVLVTLYYMDNQPIGEISEITGLSESNVKVRLHRIRKKLYKELETIISMKNII